MFHNAANKSRKTSVECITIKSPSFFSQKPILCGCHRLDRPYKCCIFRSRKYTTVYIDCSAVDGHHIYRKHKVTARRVWNIRRNFLSTNRRFQQRSSTYGSQGGKNFKTGLMWARTISCLPYFVRNGFRTPLIPLKTN